MSTYAPAPPRPSTSRPSCGQDSPSSTPSTSRATYHQVQQGEFLAQIAVQYGFSDYHTIWDHPANAQLKRQRPSPNVLFPGDILFIPDKKDKQESRSTGRVHAFRIGEGTVALRIVLKDVSDRPVDGAVGQLREDKGAETKTSGGDGLVEYEIPLKTHEAMLTVKSPKITGGIRGIPLIVGDLNPLVEEKDWDRQNPEKVALQKAAWRDRLNNLGYFAGFEAADEHLFRWAVEEFQCEHAGCDHHPKKPTGLCDHATLQAMLKTYGC